MIFDYCWVFLRICYFEGAMDKILLVDDNKETLMIESKLLGQDYEVMTCNEGKNAVATMKYWEPDLVLLDIEMPEVNGFEVLKDMHTNGISVPVVGLTGDRKKETILKFISLGAAGYLVKPVNKEHLLNTVRAALSKKETTVTQYKVLVIDDDPESLAIYKTALSKEYKIIGLSTPKMALDYLNSYVPDMIIMDYNMPVYNGKFMIKYIREHENLRAIPVIIFSGAEDKETLEEIENLHPQGFVKKTDGVGELKSYMNAIFDSLME